MVKIIGREKGEALKNEEGLTTVKDFAIVMEGLLNVLRTLLLLMM